MRDELTGVFNRRFLMETIKNEKLRCERNGGAFSICILMPTCSRTSTTATATW